jgi:hypothetical protein
MASTDLKMTSDGDLDCSAYDLKFVSGVERVAQQVTILLRSFLGEWFLDLDYGVPWFQNIIGVKPVNIDEVTNILRARILTVEGMVAIEVLEIDYIEDERRAEIRFQGRATEGEVSLTVEAP